MISIIEFVEKYWLKRPLREAEISFLNLVNGKEIIILKRRIGPRMGFYSKC